MKKVKMNVKSDVAFEQGCEACICAASTRAVFSQPETSIGIMPPYAATKRLQRLVGFGRVKELIMTGRRLNIHVARFSPGEQQFVG